MRTGPADRKSTLAVSVSAAIPILGFVLAMKANSSFATFLPEWFRGARLPGEPAIEWVGDRVGRRAFRRQWSLTAPVGSIAAARTLHSNAPHPRRAFDRAPRPLSLGAPPGYLGSLLVLNGIALASGNWITLLASLIATLAAYTHRIKVEDEMLLAALGGSYAQYRVEVRALVPSLRAARLAKPRRKA